MHLCPQRRGKGSLEYPARELAAASALSANAANSRRVIPPIPQLRPKSTSGSLSELMLRSPFIVIIIIISSSSSSNSIFNSFLCYP